MKFDRPNVTEHDLVTITRMYSASDILEYNYLGGVPNRTFKIVTEEAVLAVRVCNIGYTSRAHLALELALLQHLSAVGFQYSPVPVRGLNGKYIQFWGKYPVLATVYVEGSRGDTQALTRDLCEHVGQVLAELEIGLRTYTREVPTSESYFARGDQLLTQLPSSVQTAGWDIDVMALNERWQAEKEVLLQSASFATWHVIHTDIWPPNAICRDERIVAIVDFDDCAYGPEILDLCAVLAEFPWYGTLEFRRDLARAVLQGYVVAGGSITDAERAMILPGMAVSCISWLACNAFHGVDYQESRVYEQKLTLFRNGVFIEALYATIDSALQASSS